MQYTLRQIEIFVAVAEAGHFGRAAEALHISQPTVSQEVGRLERALGIALLDRSKRSATVTAAGEVMMIEGRMLLSQADRLLDQVRLHDPSRQRAARIVASPSVVNRLLPAVISRAEQEIPSVRIEDIPVETGGVSPEMVVENADIGLGRFLTELDGFQIETIALEQVYVALSRAHPLAQRDSIALADLDDLPLLLWSREQNPVYYDYLMEICTSRGLSPMVLVSPPRIVGSRLYLLSESRAFSLVPSSMLGHLSEGLTTVPLDRPATVPLSMQWRTGDTRPQLAQLRELVREVAAGLSASTS
ncbi:LysR family transcriptional regulator [Glaciibacter psychrotolerans]|uniref:DNA-binding transcriptional LysR family regulator n=1 Tax=Glaciibacter psychrotolerans TaxID=670054 RepID=A0A7Z0EC34_9MICO|nr:LysR family transcriptional regulator [Leifsonia psychrotolerans]NYJ18706.1 DNA-binding transcriptional LysR family regulator [Leifsonia psychrotolerans]